MQGTLILALLFALLIAIFSIQNAVPVSLSFFIWEFDTSLVVVVLGAVAIGALTMWLFSYVRQFKLKRRLKKLNNQLDELYQNNQELKATKEQKFKTKIQNEEETNDR